MTGIKSYYCFRTCCHLENVIFYHRFTCYCTNCIACRWDDCEYDDEYGSWIRHEFIQKEYCICNKPQSGNMILCSGCNDWCHVGTCVHPTEEELADQDWYCPRDACQLLKQQRNNQNIRDAENEIDNDDDVDL